MRSVALKSVTTINPTKPRNVLSCGKLAFLPMAALLAKRFEVSPRDFIADDEVKTGLTYFEDGDVLVAKITPCFENGKIALVCSDGQPGFGSTEFHVVRASNQIDRRYLAHFLRLPSIRRTGEKIMTGSAGQKRVPRTFLETLKIPLPTLTEQKRIAAILDQADELCRKRQRALDRLNQLGQSIFYEMFGDPKLANMDWEALPFSEACEDQTSQSEKLQRGKYLTTGAFPVVDQGQSLIAGWSDNSDMVCRSAHPLVVFGDHTRIVKYIDFRFVIGADGAKVLVPSRRFQPRYFSELLKLLPIPDLGYSRHMREVKRLLFPCPPMSIQVAFSEKLAIVENIRTKFALLLDHSSKIFNSLQHSAFRGEL